MAKIVLKSATKSSQFPTTSKTPTLVKTKGKPVGKATTKTCSKDEKTSDKGKPMMKACSTNACKTGGKKK